MPGRRGKLLLGLAAAVLTAAGGSYLLLSQTRVDAETGAGEAGVSERVTCGNAFAGGRRIEDEPTTATGSTGTATTSAETTAPPTTSADTTAADAAADADEAAADAAADDCAAAKRPRTIAGGILTATGLAAVVILTQLLDTARFAEP